MKTKILLIEIQSVLNDYSQTRPLSAAPKSYFQAELQEAMFKLALTTGIVEAQNKLEQINIRN